jgi:hypothetical protein
MALVWLPSGPREKVAQKDSFLSKVWSSARDIAYYSSKATVKKV